MLSKNNFSNKTAYSAIKQPLAPLRCEERSNCEKIPLTYSTSTAPCVLAPLRETK